MPVGMSLQATANIVCPSCGYDLRGRASDRCPECGLDVKDIELWNSGISWRKTQRKFDVFEVIQTPWDLLVRPLSAGEMALPADLRRSRRCRLAFFPPIAMTGLILSIVSLAAWEDRLLDYQPSSFCADQVRLIRTMYGPGALLVHVVAPLIWAWCASGVQSFWFYERGKSDDDNARAISISHYFAAPMGTLFFAALLGAQLLAIIVLAAGGEAFDFARPALTLPAFVLLGWLITSWRAAQALASIRGASKFRFVGLAIGWPACGIALFALWMLVVPWMIALAWVIVRSW